jgi:hypothetical protein
MPNKIEGRDCNVSNKNHLFYFLRLPRVYEKISRYSTIYLKLPRACLWKNINIFNYCQLKIVARFTDRLLSWTIYDWDIWGTYNIANNTDQQLISTVQQQFEYVLAVVYRKSVHKNSGVTCYLYFIKYSDDNCCGGSVMTSRSSARFRFSDESVDAYRRALE